MLHTLPQNVITLSWLIRATEQITSLLQKVCYYYSLHMFDGNHGYYWYSAGGVKRITILCKAWKHRGHRPWIARSWTCSSTTVCVKNRMDTCCCFQLQYGTPLILEPHSDNRNKGHKLLLKASASSTIDGCLFSKLQQIFCSAFEETTNFTEYYGLFFILQEGLYFNPSHLASSIFKNLEELFFGTCYYNSLTRSFQC